MSEKIQIQTQVSVETKQAKARLDSFLQDSSKWNSKMAQQLSLDVQFLFPSQSEVAKQFEKYRKTAQSQFKKVNWEFMYYSKNGKESGSQVFNYTNTKLDYATAVSELKRLKELRERILSGKAVSYGDWAEKDTKALEKLIQNLEKTTLAFEQLQRTRSKNITRETTAAANREIDEARREERRREEIRKQGTQANKEAGLWVSRRQADAESNRIINGGSSNATLASMRQYYKSLEQASKNVLDIEKRIARERARNVRGGGSLESSILRQIDLYRRLAEAAKKAGNAQTAALAGKKVRALEEQARGLGILNNLFGRQGRIMTGLQSVAARYFSIYTVTNFARKVAETTGYFQQQQVALEGILGSAAKARDTLAEIKNFALQSPFQTKELVTFTKQLAAFGVGNNDLFPTVKKLADISAGLGVDMSRIILAYGQVKSAAVLRGQELRQFTEAGIPMVQKLADKFTELNGKLVTTGEVFKLISERQVPFEMVAQVLSDMTAEGGQFYKMQENITNTTYGQIQKLRDLWTIAMDDMGKAASGPINTILKGMQNIVKNIQPIFTMITSTVIGSALGRGLTSIYRMIRALKIMRATAAATRGVMSTMLGGIGLVVGAIVGLVYNAKQKSQELTRTMADVANSYDKDTRRMISGLDSLSKKINSSAVGTKAYNDAISTLASNYGDFISNSTIKALQGEGEAARKAADEFANLAETLKTVINRQQQYNQLEAQGKAAAELSAKNTGEKLISDQNLKNLFRNSIQVAGAYGTNNSYSSQLLPGVQEYIDSHKGVTEDSLIKSVSGIIENALVEAAELGYDNTTKKGNKAIRRLFASRIKEIYGDFDPEMIKGIVDNAMSLSDWKSYEASMSTYAAAAATTLGRITKPFKDLDKKLQSGKYNLSPTADSIDKEVTKEALALEALRKSISKANLPIKSGSKLDDLLKNADPEDEAFAYNILQALEEFKNGRTNSQIGDISTIMRMFSERVGVRSGHAARITDRFRDRNSVVGKWRGNDNLANIVATFGAPTDDTYEDLRSKLHTRKSEVEQAIKDMKKGPYHAKDLQDLQEQLKALTILQGDEYYGIGDKKTKDSGSGGGWRRMFADLFGWIKEARDEEKKLVEFSAGLTEELASQIGSEQLKDTAVRAFWDNGSPFKKFIDKMDEYGIETEIFSKDFLQKELSGIITKQIEETGTVDYKDVWNQLIEILNKRSDSLKSNQKLASTVDAIKSYLAQMTIEGDKLFGRSAVEKLIEDQLKELRTINSKFDKIAGDRKMFERIGGASNFLQAQNTIYGNSAYKTYFRSNTSTDKLLEMLRGTAGSGITQTKAGESLLHMIEGGKLTIGSLSELSRLRDELIAEANKLQNGTEAQQAVFEQFKGVRDQFDGMLKQLIDDIIQDFEEFMKYKDLVTKSADEMLAAYKKLIDAQSNIAKGVQDGTISGGRAERMRINELQEFYGSIVKGIPDYVKRLYGAETNSGLSKTGNGLAMWLNDNPLIAPFAKKQAELLRQKQQKIENDFDKRLGQEGLTDKDIKNLNIEKEMALTEAADEAAIAVDGFAMELAIATAIIKEVDKTIQGVTKLFNSTFDALEATNGLYEGDDGNFYNKNDYTLIKDGLNIISEFSSGISSSIQSLLSGDILGGAVGFGSTIAKFFENIFNLRDKAIQREQNKIIASNKSLERALTNLEHVVQGLAGKDVWANQTAQIEKLEKEKENYEKLKNLELSKKHGDADKAEEYRNAGEQAQRDIDNIRRGIQEEIFGTADDIATSLTDAFVEAFRNGENAARAWRDTVRGYLGDVLKNVLLEKVLAPKIDRILDRFMGGETDPDKILSKFNNAGNAVSLRSQLFALEQETATEFANLPRAIQEMIAWNSNSSELTGGIQGITEDTARTLEGLSNSMLAQLVLINRSTEDISPVMQSQLNELRNIQKNAANIEKATSVIQSILEGSRDDVHRLHVQMH